MKGNDFFKANEYKNAIAEYTQSLTICPTAVVYNNRAMACKFVCLIIKFFKFLLFYFFLDLKLYDNANAIKDCDQCLIIEPSNIKALLRKGQALVNENKSNLV